ncbi:MAG TPA: transglycosylase SLT domain-containing protein [Dermatophilaceae bacterium]|nr:transglycosylase SLT domain-containing protein [Dermatophilaceae bacterium]
MTVDLSGVAGAQARIASIQAQLAAISGVRPPVDAAQAGAATFESALAKASASTPLSQALGEIGSTGGVRGIGSGGATGSAAVAAARTYLGVPYKWGGTDPAGGLDCSGLVQRAYADIGVRLPRVAADQARQGTRVESLSQAKPGDLVAFGNPVNHIGIYIGDNKMIVAPRTGDVVKVQTVYRAPTAIRRILPDHAVGSAGRSAVGTASLGSLTSLGAAAPGSALAAAPAAYRRLFEAAGARHGVPAALLAAVAKAESGFNAAAVSRAGAIGLMQIMPATARSLKVDPRNPAEAVDGAARLLRDGLRTFGSTQLALAAYNAGPGAVRRYGGVPPYAETTGYVRKIMADPGVRAG